MKINLDCILTLIELQNFLETDCYNLNFFSTLQNEVNDSYRIEFDSNLLILFYYDRGTKKTVKYFLTEVDAIKYITNHIINDKMAKSHHYGTFPDPTEIKNINQMLTVNKIDFWSDKIPYLGINNIAVRFFIIGCDINKVKLIDQKN